MVKKILMTQRESVFPDIDWTADGSLPDINIVYDGKKTYLEPLHNDDFDFGLHAELLMDGLEAKGYSLREILELMRYQEWTKEKFGEYRRPEKYRND